MTCELLHVEDHWNYLLGLLHVSSPNMWGAPLPPCKRLMHNSGEIITSNVSSWLHVGFQNDFPSCNYCTHSLLFGEEFSLRSAYCYTQNNTCIHTDTFAELSYSCVVVFGNKAHETSASWNHTCLGYTPNFHGATKLISTFGQDGTQNAHTHTHAHNNYTAISWGVSLVIIS